MFFKIEFFDFAGMSTDEVSDIRSRHKYSVRIEKMYCVLLTCFVLSDVLFDVFVAAKFKLSV